MGNVFFRIVGIFSTLAAALALLGAIGLAIFGVKTLTHHEVPPPIVAPHPTPDDFLKQNAPGAAAADGGSAALGKDDSARTAPLIARIVKALNAYATAANQNAVDAEDLTQKLAEKTQGLTPDQYAQFLNALAVESEKLPALAPKVLASQQTETPIDLDASEFAGWYADTYMAPFADQGASGSGQSLEDAGNKTFAYALLGGAVAAFGAFVTFTMMLLLVRIESNTRRASAS